MKGRQAVMLSVILLGVAAISLAMIEKNLMLSLILDIIIFLVSIFILYYTHKELDEYIISKTKFDLQRCNEETKDHQENLEDEVNLVLSNAAYRLHKISYIVNIMILIIVSILIGIALAKIN